MLLRSRPNIPPLERKILLVSKMESYKVELGAQQCVGKRGEAAGNIKRRPNFHGTQEET